MVPQGAPWAWQRYVVTDGESVGALLRSHRHAAKLTMGDWPRPPASAPARSATREAEARARLQEALQVFTDIGEEDSAAPVRAELLA
jgi:hypothetical protein